MAIDINQLIKDYKPEGFIMQMKSDVNSSNCSYEQCRSYFINHKVDEADDIALYLYYYLASWGMLRNSFLMYKDYKFLIPVVKELKNYKRLQNVKSFDQETIEIIADSKKDESVKSKICKCLNNKKYIKDEFLKPASEEKVYTTKATETLITKIILGTLGCVPAYDTYLCRALKECNIIRSFTKDGFNDLLSRISKESMEKLQDHAKKINKARKCKVYSSMKVLDMVLWEKGAEIIANEKLKKELTNID